MKPTAKLRFVERDLGYTKVRVLQQWWEHTEWNAPGEWRDVPLGKEE